jgi:mono/diheme cytochrome c family protein
VLLLPFFLSGHKTMSFLPLNRNLFFSAVLAGLALLPGAARAADAEPLTPPFDLNDPSRIALGKVRFGTTCAAYCHGREGDGGKTPAFKGRKDLTPELAFKTITEGRRTTDVMPPWGNAFTPTEIWELVAYIHHLTTLPPTDQP